MPPNDAVVGVDNVQVTVLCGGVASGAPERLGVEGLVGEDTGGDDIVDGRLIVANEGATLLAGVAGVRGNGADVPNVALPVHVSTSA